MQFNAIARRAELAATGPTARSFNVVKSPLKSAPAKSRKSRIFDGSAPRSAWIRWTGIALPTAQLICLRAVPLATETPRSRERFAASPEPSSLLCSPRPKRSDG